MTSLWRHICK